ncbi:hypothetical protein PR048_006788 [Dryococelus australis]|uniref:Uncharacterized protein n=1 Tax=Dryococelus australis TaxID=614101 RepID=A0ABQ9IBZ1_9NEOP|nr:hypothetical protein PR048_006788 [Dryococelus australis]
MLAVVAHSLPMLQKMDDFVDLLDSGSGWSRSRITGLVVPLEVVSSSSGIKIAASRHRPSLIWGGGGLNTFPGGGMGRGTDPGAPLNRIVDKICLLNVKEKYLGQSQLAQAHCRVKPTTSTIMCPRSTRPDNIFNLCFNEITPTKPSVIVREPISALTPDGDRKLWVPRFPFSEDKFPRNWTPNIQSLKAPWLLSQRGLDYEDNKVDKAWCVKVLREYKWSGDVWMPLYIENEMARGNGRSPRKTTYQWHRPAHFLRTKIRELPRWESNPFRLGYHRSRQASRCRRSDTFTSRVVARTHAHVVQVPWPAARLTSSPPPPSLEGQMDLPRCPGSTAATASPRAPVMDMDSAAFNTLARFGLDTALTSLGTSSCNPRARASPSPIGRRRAVTQQVKAVHDKCLVGLSTAPRSPHATGSNPAGNRTRFAYSWETSSLTATPPRPPCVRRETKSRRSSSPVSAEIKEADPATGCVRGGKGRTVEKLAADRPRVHAGTCLCEKGDVTCPWVLRDDVRLLAIRPFPTTRWNAHDSLARESPLNVVATVGIPSYKSAPRPPPISNTSTFGGKLFPLSAPSHIWVGLFDLRSHRRRGSPSRGNSSDMLDRHQAKFFHVRCLTDTSQGSSESTRSLRRGIRSVISSSPRHGKSVYTTMTAKRNINKPNTRFHRLHGSTDTEELGVAQPSYVYQYVIRVLMRLIIVFMTFILAPWWEASKLTAQPPHCTAPRRSDDFPVLNELSTSIPRVCPNSPEEHTCAYMSPEVTSEYCPNCKGSTPFIQLRCKHYDIARSYAASDRHAACDLTCISGAHVPRLCCTTSTGHVGRLLALGVSMLNCHPPGSEFDSWFGRLLAGVKRHMLASSDFRGVKKSFHLRVPFSQDRSLESICECCKRTASLAHCPANALINVAEHLYAQMRNIFLLKNVNDKDSPRHLASAWLAVTCQSPLNFHGRGNFGTICTAGLERGQIKESGPKEPGAPGGGMESSSLYREQPLPAMRVKMKRRLDHIISKITEVEPPLVSRTPAICFSENGITCQRHFGKLFVNQRLGPEGASTNRTYSLARSNMHSTALRLKHCTPLRVGATRLQKCVLVSPVWLPRFLTLDAGVSAIATCELEIYGAWDGIARTPADAINSPGRTSRAGRGCKEFLASRLRYQPPGAGHEKKHLPAFPPAPRETGNSFCHCTLHQKLLKLTEVAPGFSQVGIVWDDALVGGFSQRSPVSPPLHSVSEEGLSSFGDKGMGSRSQAPTSRHCGFPFFPEQERRIHDSESRTRDSEPRQANRGGSADMAVAAILRVNEAVKFGAWRDYSRAETNSMHTCSVTRREVARDRQQPGQHARNKNDLQARCGVRSRVEVSRRVASASPRVCPAPTESLSYHDVSGGQFIDYWWLVEFQCRGSTHSHLTVWVKNHPNFETREGILMIDRACGVKYHLKIPICCDENTCTPVQSLAPSGDGALDARGNVALIATPRSLFSNTEGNKISSQAGASSPCFKQVMFAACRRACRMFQGRVFSCESACSGANPFIRDAHTARMNMQPHVRACDQYPPRHRRRPADYCNHMLMPPREKAGCLTPICGCRAWTRHSLWESLLFRARSGSAARQASVSRNSTYLLVNLFRSLAENCYVRNWSCINHGLEMPPPVIFQWIEIRGAFRADGRPRYVKLRRVFDLHVLINTPTCCASWEVTCMSRHKNILYMRKKRLKIYLKLHFLPTCILHAVVTDMDEPLKNFFGPKIVQLSPDINAPSSLAACASVEFGPPRGQHWLRPLTATPDVIQDGPVVWGRGPVLTSVKASNTRRDSSWRDRFLIAA